MLPVQVVNSSGGGTLRPSVRVALAADGVVAGVVSCAWGHQGRRVRERGPACVRYVLERSSSAIHPVLHGKKDTTSNLLPSQLLLLKGIYASRNVDNASDSRDLLNVIVCCKAS